MALHFRSCFKDIRSLMSVGPWENLTVTVWLPCHHQLKSHLNYCSFLIQITLVELYGCIISLFNYSLFICRFPDAETASAIAELGCKHICKNVNESHVDKANKIVTTCAFMCKAPLHEIFDGIGTMVQEVLKLAWLEVYRLLQGHQIS